MASTFLVLLTAYLVAEFPLRPSWAPRQSWLRLAALALHLVIVAIVTTALLGALEWPILVLMLLPHLALDAGASPEKSVGSFVFEQLAQVVLLAAATLAFPTAFDVGWGHALGGGAKTYLVVLAILAGLILNLPVGGTLIGLITGPLRMRVREDLTSGLPNGSLYIGWLERALVMLFILIDQATGVGFVITAKSILRFSDVQDFEHRKASEYIIIGTFLSFGWGLIVSLLTRWAIRPYLP